MRMQGVKVLETQQIEWLVMTAEECPDLVAEQLIIQTYFRIPHAPWSTPPAFVEPVRVRRTRKRVLFCQPFGLTL
jgi:hypothetical protein